MPRVARSTPHCANSLQGQVVIPRDEARCGVAWGRSGCMSSVLYLTFEITYVDNTKNLMLVAIAASARWRQVALGQDRLSNSTHYSY